LFGDRVEHVVVDLAHPEGALKGVFDGVDHVVFTAAVGAGPAKESEVRAVDFGGVAATVTAANEAGFRGRFVYMTTTGVHHRSAFMGLLNFLKGDLSGWRARAEQAIADSGLDYVIVRAGALTNGAGGRALQITEGDRPLTFGTWVNRSDVAATILERLFAGSVLPRDISVVHA
jgi:uncharacterized protein YbjT (DUF2867 family)